MEPVLDFLYENIRVILFCIALSIFLMISGALNKQFDIIKKNINESPVIYEQVKEDVTENEIKYEDVIGSLINGLSYNIEINNIVIQVDSFNYLLFDYSQIPKTLYTKTIQYNKDEQIEKIIYKSKS